MYKGMLKKYIFEQDIDNKIYLGESYDEIRSWLIDLLWSREIDNLLYMALEQYLNDNYIEEE